MIGSYASKSVKMSLLIIALAAIIAGGCIAINAAFDYYHTIDQFGKAYFGSEVLSKNNTSLENAGIFAEARKQVALAKMRDFTQIIIGLFMAISGLFCCYRLLPREGAGRKDVPVYVVRE